MPVAPDDFRSASSSILPGGCTDFPDKSRRPGESNPWPDPDPPRQSLSLRERIARLRAILRYHRVPPTKPPGARGRR